MCYPPQDRGSTSQFYIQNPNVHVINTEFYSTSPDFGGFTRLDQIITDAADPPTSTNQLSKTLCEVDDLSGHKKEVEASESSCATFSSSSACLPKRSSAGAQFTRSGFLPTTHASHGHHRGRKVTKLSWKPGVPGWYPCLALKGTFN